MADTPGPSDKPTKIKQRHKLTPFLCQEMLYDYVLNRLDADRRGAVEAFLKTDEESRRVLEAINHGLAFSASLAKTSLKPEILENIRESENAISIGKKYSSWKEWPEAFRWSVTAISLSAVIALVVALIPWSRIPSFKSAKRSDSIEIAEISRLDGKALEGVPDDPEATGADEGSGDEEIEAPEADSAKAKPGAAVAVDEGDEGDGPAPLPKNAKAAVPAPPVATPKSTPTPRPVIAAATPLPVAHVAAAENVTEATADDAEVKESKAKGFVYRAFMNLANLDEVGPKIADSVVELGGEKAGEVELGWKRGTGRYYHFVMPEENEEKLMEKLRAYGPVRLSKDPHPRVMPKGQVRFILWVESAH